MNFTSALQFSSSRHTLHCEMSQNAHCFTALLTCPKAPTPRKNCLCQKKKNKRVFDEYHEGFVMKGLCGQKSELGNKTPKPGSKIANCPEKAFTFLKSLKLLQELKTRVKTKAIWYRPEKHSPLCTRDVNYLPKKFI